MRYIIFLLLCFTIPVFGQFAPPANQMGTTAIHKDSSVIVNWATGVAEFVRGPQDIAVGGGVLANYGDSTAALHYAQGNSNQVVSLGDGGSIVLTFQYPIKNGPGPDFAVFENGFSHDYLEFAHVEVSTDGVNFVRFPSQSFIQNTVQTGPFETSNTQEVDNLAGKYIQGYGTPFDLEELLDSTNLNVDSINFVKLIDVVGSIDNTYGTTDSQGNLINDTYPTAFGSGGFDVDGVAVIHENNLLASYSKIESNVTVYPNPANDFVFISFDGIQQVELFGLDGQLHFKTTVQNQLMLNLSEINLSKGMYLLKIGESTTKLMVH